MAKDKDYISLINTGRWRSLRAEVLARHPLCQRCASLGYITAATEVHHVHPVEWATTMAEKRRLMYSPSNLSPLCHSCHVETHREMGRRNKDAVKTLNEAHTKSMITKLFE